MIKKVVMPAAGQTTDIATVTKLKVQVGDPVKKGDVLLEVETDKAVLPIESFAKGFVTAVYVSEFDTVDAGTPLLAIGDAADLEAAKSAPAEAEPAPMEEDEEDDFAPVKNNYFIRNKHKEQIDPWYESVKDEIKEKEIKQRSDNSDNESDNSSKSSSSENYSKYGEEDLYYKEEQKEIIDNIKEYRIKLSKLLMCLTL